MATKPHKMLLLRCSRKSRSASNLRLFASYTPMLDISAVQAALTEYDFDGWLLYDFRGSNVLAKRVLGIGDDVMGSRRFMYFIPKEGEPRKLCHRIEAGMLDHLPGEKTIYLKWQELEAGVASLVSGSKRIAMEYSPRNANPYISRVDAGTVELVRSNNVEVANSGDLIQLFEATLDEDQEASHFEASKLTHEAFLIVWQLIADTVRKDGSIEEMTVSDRIMKHFADNAMETYHPPIVGVGPNGGDPHYETGTGANTVIKEGDLVLVDLWAKMSRPGAIYSDQTRMGFVGTECPTKYEEVFAVACAGRDAGIKCVKDAFASSTPLQGWEVDDATRAPIEAAGLGEFFVHRTGHNIGQEVHGNGAHIDNLETKETRRILPRTCFSIEPGIYQPEFGVRTEIDVYIGADGEVHVTGGELQSKVECILAGR